MKDSIILTLGTFLLLVAVMIVLFSSNLAKIATHELQIEQKTFITPDQLFTLENQ